MARDEHDDADDEREEAPPKKTVSAFPAGLFDNSAIFTAAQRTLAAQTAAWQADLTKSSSIHAQIADIVKQATSASRMNDEVLAAVARASATTAYQNQWADVMKAISATWSPLADLRNYQRPDPPAATYSAELTSPGEYYASSGYELEISSFAQLNTAIVRLTRNNPTLDLVWRGMRNAEWGVHSSLFRKLALDNGVELPEPGKPAPVGEQSFPTEDEMVLAEAEILRIARDYWRWDDVGALEIFARVQHAGGPTRLIDVTHNPYIGAWFAVEEHRDTDDDDARLLAFATHAVPKPGEEAPDSRVRLDAEWAGRVPTWHTLSEENRPAADWGTGTLRRVWFPPHYDPRIFAQNAGFILDGVPITSEKTAKYFKNSITGEPWTRADLLAAGSTYVRLANAKIEAKTHASRMAPTFTFRITAAAKREIRTALEDRFGYRHASIYPDSGGLASKLTNTVFPGL